MAQKKQPKQKPSKPKQSAKGRAAASKKPRSKAPIMLGITLLILLILQEVVFRVCFPIPEIKNFNRINYQILEPGPNRPPDIHNIKMGWTSSPDTAHQFIHSLNQYGYRDKFWSETKPSGSTRVMFVGDSFVEGMMSTQDKTVLTGFEEASNGSMKLDLMNCGMMGIGINEYIKFMGQALPLFKPDHVVLVLYSNDIPFTNPYKPGKPAKARYNSAFTPRLKALYDYAQKDDPIPFRWSGDITPYYKAVPDKSNPWTFHEATYAEHVLPELADAMKKGEFNFYRTNWALEEAKFLAVPTSMKDKLTTIKQLCALTETQLTVYYVPSRVQVSTYYYQFDRKSCLVNCPDMLDLTGPEYRVQPELLAKECEALGIHFFDLTDEVEAEEDAGNHLYWDYDDHMRSKGYLFLGRNMWEQWPYKNS